jgi:hypothetical protein
MVARYWIAQHVEDLFRNEPRNVGVFVRVGSSVAARFFGEVEGGGIDGRKLKCLPYPDVYRQWVEYWRDQVASGREKFEQISGSHYRVVEGGAVSDIDRDSAEEVAAYLYSLLVSEGRFREAIPADMTEGEVQAETDVPTLEDDLSKTLKQIDLLADQGTLLVRHPIKRRADISGKILTHRPSFVQENGALYVMETVDFTFARKKSSIDHAGLSAYMFRDIKEARRNVEPIAIVRLPDQGELNSDIRYGLAMLRNEASLVNWGDEGDKRQFLADRRNVALSM